MIIYSGFYILKMFIKLQPIGINSFIGKFKNFGVIAPLPYQFASHPLQSTLAVDLSEIVNKINELMPQLSDFIHQFQNVVNDNSISVITEPNGNMSLDVPATMSDQDAEKLSTRIGIIDRLITTRGQEVNDLLQKGLKIEVKLKEQDSNFQSIILEKVKEFNKLNDSYKH